MLRSRRILGRHFPIPPGEVQYARTGLTFEDIWPRWPGRLQSIREVLPGGLAETGPTGMARHGTWILTANVNNKPIGLAWSVPYVGDDGWAYIEEVAVAEAWQRHGVGSSLVVGTMDWLREVGFKMVAVYPITGSSWIENLGFSPSVGGQFICRLSDPLE